MKSISGKPMVIMFRAFFFALLVALTCDSAAQSAMQLIKAGDKKMEEGAYYVAGRYYADALRKEETNVAVWYKLAEASRMFSDYAGAAAAYKSVLKLDKANQFPMASFWLGITLRSVCSCKSEDAVSALKKFRSRYRTNDFFAAKAQQEMEACAWAADHSQPAADVTIEHLGREVNSEKSEFGAMHVFPDRLQFSAIRNIGRDEKEEKYLSRIYNQMPNPEKVFVPSGANENLHIGNGAYAPDARKLYFTQCEQKGEADARCDIYVSRYENFSWTPAQKLNINDAGATSTHPAVAVDEAGSELLFFSSDREGGIGGLDLWVSKALPDGSFQAPINLGKTINTPGNEVTPFYDVNNKKLFFSSDWHYGFGGYDIFETKGQRTDWSAPVNLMQPVNSPQNDLYYSVALDDSKAYITSNRKGSYFIESETCCNDIYAYATNRKKPQPAAVKKPQEVVVLDTPETVRAVPPAIADMKPGITKYLPVRLYFHNDEPDAKTMSDTTQLDYKTTYERYADLRNEYRREFSKGLKGDAKTAAIMAVDALYKEKVDRGYYDLVAFTAQLLDLLEKGNKVSVTIKGYCSPLNDNEYNIKLGYRRVASLRNYFFSYRNKALVPYIGSGALQLINESNGEETAAKEISDARSDLRNSVYNPDAAGARRVEIVSVTVR